MTTQTTQLFKIVIRLSKEDSAFFYFQLEANDGLCFYSTLEHPHHAQYRDIEMKGDIKLKNELMHVLKRCEEKFKIEYLTNEVISDTRKS